MRCERLHARGHVYGASDEVILHPLAPDHQADKPQTAVDADPRSKQRQPVPFQLDIVFADRAFFPYCCRLCSRRIFGYLNKKPPSHTIIRSGFYWSVKEADHQKPESERRYPTPHIEGDSL